MSKLACLNLVISVSTPLLLGKKSKLKDQCLYSLIIVFFRLTNKSKPIATCDGWRLEVAEMKQLPTSKQSRRHAKRRRHYQKYQSVRQLSNQCCKKVSRQGGRDDYHTA